MTKKTNGSNAKIDVFSDSARLVLSKEAQRLLQIFIEQHPPLRLTKNLRKMTFHFLASEGGIEEEYLADLLYDLDALFNVLEDIEFKIIEK